LCFVGYYFIYLIFIYLFIFTYVFLINLQHFIIEMRCCVASVFFNVRIVSKSPAEFSPSISDFMELRSIANLPCLVNLTPSFLCTDVT